jgi:hypothetical protein
MLQMIAYIQVLAKSSRPFEELQCMVINLIYISYKIFITILFILFGI